MCKYMSEIRMKDIIIFRRDDVLSPTRALYYKDLFYRTLKIGTEIEAATPKGMKREIFEEHLRQQLEPSGSLEQIGKWGVLDVQAEHCGIEIRVIGRHPYFEVFYNQFAHIFEVIHAEGGRARPTCGMHFHLLPIGLSEPIPEIILANVWNLVRRYAPNLKFITSAGDKPEALCRRRNHNSHLEMVKHTPAAMNMQQIKEALDNSRVVPKHQNFLNLEHLTFTEQHEIKDFHLELRFPDADFSPTSVTVKAFLCLAMILKAVDMSQYGVIHVGKLREWRRKKELLDMLNNNDGNLATSDTSQVTPAVIEELRAGCRELLALLKPSLTRFERNPSFEILCSLAENPISLRRIQGYSWQEIEQQLSLVTALYEPKWDKVDKQLMRYIEFAEFAECAAEEDWKAATAKSLFSPVSDIEDHLRKIASFRAMRWDAQLGTYVFLS